MEEQRPHSWWWVAVSTMLLVVACGDPTEPVLGNSSNDCDPTACPYFDEVVVDSCEGEDICYETEICGEPALCAQRSHCHESPTCPSGATEVDSCEGLDDCTVESEADFACLASDLYCSRDEIIASNYDQSCDTASDCLAINQGAACACESCPDAAINKEHEDRVRREIDRAMCEEECNPDPCEQDLVTACVSGTCVVQEAESEGL